jgi:hypothetical protein
MYEKLIDGVLHRAPKMLHIGSNNVWSPDTYWWGKEKN